MNTVMMVFPTLCLVLIVWVLYGFKLGFGPPLVNTFIGDPRSILGAHAETGQGNIPLVSPGMPVLSTTGTNGFNLPGAAVEFFQFVFAAITPILFIGTSLGRISSKVWLIFVPPGMTLGYCVNASLLLRCGGW